MSSILIGGFKMPAEVVLQRMVPGTAVGVLVGDAIYSWLAMRLARREQRQDVCAMPLGIDTPSLFALSLGVIGPAYLETKDAMAAWAIGTAVLFMMGLVKVLAAFFGDALRRALPGAALIAVLSAVAVALIMFIPFTKLMVEPIGGLVALGVVLLALIGRVRMPAGLPVVPIAMLLGALCIGAASWFGYVTPARVVEGASLGLNLPSPSLQFLSVSASSATLPADRIANCTCDCDWRASTTPSRRALRGTDMKPARSSSVKVWPRSLQHCLVA